MSLDDSFLMNLSLCQEERNAPEVENEYQQHITVCGLHVCDHHELTVLAQALERELNEIKAGAI